MHAMALTRPKAGRVEPIEKTVPTPGPGQIAVTVRACGVCRTDLHVVDGDLPSPAIPVIPGHEIVGLVERVGAGVTGFAPGDRVGIPWLGYACGRCEFCRSDRENLCPNARYTGYQIDGGYAEQAIADARFCFHLPGNYDDEHAAPLLCAGLIGYRAYRMAGDARRLGIYGFGAAAHIIAQVAVQQGREVYAFVTPGDTTAADFARTVGASWSGWSTEAPPTPLDAAIIFAPVGRLVPEALSRTRPGGVVVCAGIHMSDIPSFPYRLLWQERIVRSVANLTRADARDFLALTAALPIRTTTTPYPLREANTALEDLRSGRLNGAAVIVPSM
jgi:alcohol dehydrogenase, propanol-preferring